MSLYKYLIEAISLSDNDLRQYILNSTPNVKSEKLKRIYSIIKSSEPEGIEDTIKQWFEDRGINKTDIVEDILYGFEKYGDLIEFIRYIDPENHNRKTLKEAFPRKNTNGSIPDIFKNLKDKNGDPIIFNNDSLKSIATYNQAGGVKVGHYEYLLRIMSDDATNNVIQSMKSDYGGDIFGNGVAIELKASSKTKSQSDPRCKSHNAPTAETIVLFRNVLNNYISKWNKEDNGKLELLAQKITGPDYKPFDKGEIFNKKDTFKEAIASLYSQLGETAQNRIPEALADAFCVYWNNSDTNDKLDIQKLLSEKLSSNNLDTEYINALFGAINLYLYQKEEKFTNIVIVDPNMNYINIADFNLDALFKIFVTFKKVSVTKMPNEKSNSPYDCAACIRYNK